MYQQNNNCGEIRVKMNSVPFFISSHLYQPGEHPSQKL